MRNAIVELTLPSGAEIKIRRQPAEIIQRLTEKAESEFADSAPKPPTQLVEIGPGQTREEANPTHPEYLAALQVHRATIQARMGQLMIDTMRKVAIITPTDTEAVAELRQNYAELGIELDPDDRKVWMDYLICPTQEDAAHLMFEIFGKSLPREGQIAMHKRLFRNSVEGNAA